MLRGSRRRSSASAASSTTPATSCARRWLCTRPSLELALRHGSSAEDLRAAIASGLEGVDRLARLADDLLVVARSEDGKLAIERQRLSVSELLAGVGQRFAMRTEETGRALTSSRPSPTSPSQGTGRGSSRR